jgi:hypothetical protein
MRLNLKLLLSGLLLVLLAFCSSVSFAASSTATSQQEETISVPLSDWNKLKTNLIEADASIKSSNLSLNEAQALTVKQATELQELKIINEERSKELAELKTINKKQGEELEKASQITTEQADSLAKASTSLDELKMEIKNNRRTEQRLRRQRDTWAISNAALFLASALRR